MKKYIRVISVCTFIAALVACNKDGNSNPPNNAKANLSTSTVDTGGSTQNRTYSGGDKTTDLLKRGSLKKVLCENPINLIENNQKPLEMVDELQRAKYQLVKMVMYSVNEADNYSFLASAQASDDFKAKLDCNGVRDVQDFNYKKSWTDENGTQHSEVLTYTSKFSGEFHISTTIDGNKNDHEKATTSRVFEVKFENGKLASAQTRIDDGRIEPSDLKKILQDRLEVTENTYLSLRVYNSNSDQLDFRIKIEFPADKNGKRIIQHSQAIFERTK